MAFNSGSRSPAASAKPWERIRLQLGGERSPVRDRPVCIGLELRGRVALREREHDLAGGRRVADARAPEPRDALHDRRALDEVDCHGMPFARRRQGHRLARLLGKRPEVGVRDLTQVEARQDRVAKLEETQAQPVAPALGHVLDVAGVRERGEEAGHGAGVDPGQPGDLVRPQLPPGGEDVENREPPLDGSDVASGWMSGSAHGRFRLAIMDTPLPRRQ